MSHNYMVILQTEQRNAVEKLAEDQTETYLASNTEDRLLSQREPDVEKAMADDFSGANHLEKNDPDDSGSDDGVVPKERPMSPETLALMCDEQDTIFMAAAHLLG